MIIGIIYNLYIRFLIHNVFRKSNMFEFELRMHLVMVVVLVSIIY